jgi:hypothetical protein
MLSGLLLAQNLRKSRLEYKERIRTRHVSPEVFTKVENENFRFRIIVETVCKM